MSADICHFKMWSCENGYSHIFTAVAIKKSLFGACNRGNMHLIVFVCACNRSQCKNKEIVEILQRLPPWRDSSEMSPFTLSYNLHFIFPAITLCWPLKHITVLISQICIWRVALTKSSILVAFEMGNTRGKMKRQISHKIASSIHAPIFNKIPSHSIKKPE